RHTRFSPDWSSDVCSSDLPGLFEHGDFEGFVELGIKMPVRFGEVDVAEVEPLAGKVFGKCRRPRIIQHSLNLGPQRLWISQIAEIGRASCRERAAIRADTV